MRISEDKEYNSCELGCPGCKKPLTAKEWHSGSRSETLVSLREEPDLADIGGLIFEHLVMHYYYEIMVTTMDLLN